MAEVTVGTFRSLLRAWPLVILISGGSYALANFKTANVDRYSQTLTTAVVRLESSIAKATESSQKQSVEVGKLAQSVQDLRPGRKAEPAC